jgi:hypothetical protein
MNWKLLPGAGAATLALAVVIATAAAAAGSSIVTGTTAIGGYHVGAGWAQAQRLFGGPYSSTQDRTVCTAQWRNGVTITWKRTLPYADWAKGCVKFSSAKLTGKQWRTDKGLQIGSVEAQVHSRYPAAKSSTANGFHVWRLASGAGVSLEAWVKAGRVAFLRLSKG